MQLNSRIALPWPQIPDLRSYNIHERRGCSAAGPEDGFPRNIVLCSVLRCSSFECICCVLVGSGKTKRVESLEGQHSEREKI